MKKKMIDATIVVKGKFANDIEREAFSNPSEKSLKKNEKASKLVAMLKG